MAKLKTERFTKKEHNIDFKYDINVSAAGDFYTTLPENIVTMLENASITMHCNPNKRGSKKGYFSNKTIPDLILKVESAITDYLSTTIVSEAIVLRYSIQTQCTYVITKDGDIGPNGSYSQLGGNGFKGGTVHPFANDNVPYGFQVFIKPLLKRVLRYKSGKLVTEYTLMCHAGKNFITNEYYKLGKHGQWLDDIVGIGKLGGEKEIPYTEKMAEFFVNMIKSICKLNEKIKDHLSPEALMLMANNNQKLLD